MSRRNGKAKKKQALAPETTPPDPSRGRVSVLYLPQRTAGVRVTEDNALTCGPVFACTRVISESLAALPCRVHRGLPGGGSVVDDQSDVDWLVHVQANPETAAGIFREVMVAWALTWGNGYAEIERDYAGRPQWLWQLAPDRVRPARTARGNLVYDVWNPHQSNTVLDAADVVHLKGLGFDGLVGYPVIAMAAREIGAGMAADEFAAAYFANDSTPGGLLEHPDRLSPEAAANLRESWQLMHGGPRNRRRVAVLEEGMHWKQTGLPPQDSQLVEVRNLTPKIICMWFRVPPHKIGWLEDTNRATAETEEIAFVVDTLMPWAVRLEQEMNIKLFGRVNRGSLFVKHSFNARLRGDSKSRSEFYRQMLDRAVFSINDVLDREDMNPIGKDGDKRFVQQNMTTLERAGEEPVTPPPGAGGDVPAQDGPPPEEKPGGLSPREALMPVLVEACGRVLKREAGRIEDARKRLKDQGEEKWREWAVAFQGEHLNYAKYAVMPGAMALGSLLGQPSPSVAVAVGVGVWMECYTYELNHRLDGVEGPPPAEPESSALLLARQVEAACAAVGAA